MDKFWEEREMLDYDKSCDFYRNQPEYHRYQERRQAAIQARQDVIEATRNHNLTQEEKLREKSWISRHLHMEKGQL